ncbi:MAG: ferritin family protein [Bacteroidales bacterium]|jgi:rubrerythrin/uncharacterized membrane protein|nr:DUF2231 domain-containing protein [Bacteroidales bacterium]MDD4214209.1 ferritin family protein [Bacteroidales bacterium]
MFDTSHFHPMLVHFPVALIIVGFIADLFSLFFNNKKHCLSKVGFYMMILGTLGAIGGYFTGEFFTRDFSGEAGELKERHEVFAKITMFVMIAASLIRIYMVMKKKDHSVLKWFVFVLFFFAAVSVGITGFMGGSLVYNHMVSIQDSGNNVTADTTKAGKTIDYLKSALEEELTCVAKYEAFATRAAEENMPRVAVLFKSAAKSESIHAENHRIVLKQFGIQADVRAKEFTLGSTMENLESAYKDENYEDFSMYPAYIEQAQNDNAGDALKSFSWAMESELKHMEYFKNAIDALKSKQEKNLPTTYYVCPKCGFTYTSENEEDYCELCGTEKELYIVIN